jgi:SAM-dependent methyltransferase
VLLWGTDMSHKIISRSLCIVGLGCLTPAVLAWLFLDHTENPTEASQVFSAIYQNKLWGTNAEGEGHSGSGSTMKSTVVYRAYLQAFLKEHHIRSVVDAGCGDWESTQAIDWTGIDYKGYDIVEAVIAKNRKRFAAPNIHFYVADILETNLPAADLLLGKHVLQHWPNAAIHKFLRVLPRYKHALLVNSVYPETFSSDNHDIPMGHYRPLDITAKPFEVAGKKVLTYWDGFDMQQLVYIGTAP